MPNNRLLGIEWEVASQGSQIAEMLYDASLSRTCDIHDYHCGCDHCASPQVWSFQTDGSLPEEGVELRSCPVQIDQLDSVLQVAQVEQTLRDTKARITKRCGLHVHVEASDLSARQLDVLNDLFVELQPALYRIAVGTFDCHRGPEYCCPISKKEKYTLVSHPASNRRYYDRAKYFGLNLGVVPNLGTVEFRLWNSTRDAWRTRMFAATSWALVEFAARMGRGDNRVIVGPLDQEYTPELLSQVVSWAGVPEWIPEYSTYLKRQLARVDWQPVDMPCPSCSALQCNCDPAQVIRALNGSSHP